MAPIFHASITPLPVAVSARYIPEDDN